MVPEVPSVLEIARALKESVDGWPLAIIFLKTFGGKPKPITASRGVIGGWHPPPGIAMLQSAGCPHGHEAVSVAEAVLGSLVGAIGSSRGGHRRASAGSGARGLGSSSPDL